MLLLALLLAAPADQRLSLPLKAPHIQRVEPGTSSVEAEGPVRAELLPSDELLIEPLKAGVARVFLFSRRMVRVIEIAIDAPLPPPGAGGCPAVIDAKTYEACRARIAPGERVVFEPEGLQAQAKAAQLELDKAQLGHITAGFTAYGVRLKGARDEAERHRALRAIWPALLGPLRLDEP